MTIGLFSSSLQSFPNKAIAHFTFKKEAGSETGKYSLDKESKALALNWPLVDQS